jgi:phosphinothricin acetyltransferase
MTPATIRPAAPNDIEPLTAIYNHYIAHTAITFDLEPFSVERRRSEWFEHYHASGRHRLLVAERDAAVCGYACSSTFRPKGAYQTSVEVSVYLAPDSTRQGLGRRLYVALFDLLQVEDVHRAYAGITLPNPASVALHEKFGFQPIGTYHEVGRKHGKYWDVLWMEKRLG